MNPKKLTTGAGWGSTPQRYVAFNTHDYGQTEERASRAPHELRLHGRRQDRLGDDVELGHGAHLQEGGCAFRTYPTTATSCPLTSC
jgi:hypothetical protein